MFDETMDAEEMHGKTTEIDVLKQILVLNTSKSCRK